VGTGGPAPWKATRREGKHVRTAAATFGVNHQWDRVTGPYPVEDTWGMFEAACILLRSLDPGRNSKFIQHDTMRKLRGHFSSRNKCEAHFSLMAWITLGGLFIPTSLALDSGQSFLVREYILGWATVLDQIGQ
jgi:hypothetical protein